MADQPKITFISVGWASPDGEQTVISLPEMQKHCRPERIEELVDDMAVLCEDVEARRHPEDAGHPVLSVIRGQK